MTLIRAIREQLSPECLANRIRKGRCAITLDRAPSDRLIVDLDRRGGPIDIHERRCDYLFFAQAKNGQNWVAPIELKGGTVKAAQVEGQLQSGAGAIERLVPDHATVRFVPIVAGTCHREERRRLALRKVVFRGTPTRIKLRPCNTPLAAALE